MATADGYILPKPAVPKTLGILNIIFAVLLLLLGMCTLGMTILAPSLLQMAAKGQADVKARGEAAKTKQVEILDERAKQATTDEEKATIAKERDAVANAPVPETPDLAQVTAALQDPKIMGITIGQLVTGLILHVLLLVAGIGLVRLTPWGRSLGVWWAGLQIAQLVVLAVINFTVLLPAQQPINDANIANLKKQADQPGAAPGAAPAAQMAETMAKLGPVMTATYYVAAMAYPIICLVLLRTPGARAACVRRDPTLPPTMGYPAV